VLGSLIVAGVLCQREELDELVRLGVRDSKALSPARREQLYEDITSSFRWRTEEITPREIDARHRNGLSLNQLEARAMRRLIRHFSPGVAYIDCVGRSPRRFRQMLSAPGVNCSLVVEHRADERHPLVAAASIIAKVTRDRQLAELKRQYGDFGSGYPADPRTLSFLRENIHSLPPFVRSSWRTLSRFRNLPLDSFR